MVVFSCRLCGLCCHGKGGIIVSPKDLARFSEAFNMSSKDFLLQYTDMDVSKPHINTKDDGFCVFYDSDKSCTIHESRPDVCRAWPYFRGNLIDKVSFEMAKEDCLGISKDISHAVFAHTGYKYLKENDLLAYDKKLQARALILDVHELPSLLEEELGK